MEDKRPTPESLLIRAEEEARQQKSGRLKLFLGAAPGVGKTYTMLEDAVSKRAEGLDVVAGIVETHGRKETEAMLQDLECLPRQIIEYHGNQLSEFDLDRALARHPALILIDEMAHTNAPGLRHTKRWQDIKELLDHGIDVYSTLNVQHIESLNDVVAQITGIIVRETVPDSMLELADTIELVDLPPDDLLKRLQDGKVYVPAQAELATQHFFRKGNLTALRELALRVTAERVNAQVLSQRRDQSILQTWPTTERFLVCIGPNVSSTKLIRATRRMAARINAEWLAVYVESPRFRLSEEERNKAIQNLRLAEQLGAETLTLSGTDAVKEIIEFARSRNITKIVLGKQVRPRWQDRLFGSLVNELVRQSGEIDIYIIRGDAENSRPQPFNLPRPRISWMDYGIAISIVGMATLIDFLIYPTVGLNTLIMIYLLAVVLIATRGHRGPSSFASLLSVLAYDFFFLPPRYSFMVANTQYLITSLVMLVVAQIISQLTFITWQQAQSARLREQRTAALHGLSQQLARSRGTQAILRIALRYIAEVFDSEVQVLLPQDNQQLIMQDGYQGNIAINEKEKSVAAWVYSNGQIAGLGTETLPSSEAVYVPLLGSHKIVGVLRVCPNDAQRLTIPEQLHLLEACANQIALVLEVDRLEDEAKKNHVEIETERLRNALLSSVSAALRNPLAIILHTAHSLMSKTKTAPKETNSPGQVIHREAEKLNRLINNLLQITRLEAGKIELHKELYAVEELIHTAKQRVKKLLNHKPLVIQIPEDLPRLLLDHLLIEQALVNLLENAILYTPPKTSIEITATLQTTTLLIEVADHGPGLMVDEVKKVFEKFYRGQIPKQESGVGLGLAICQIIIKAHGGSIWAENRADGGAAFRFTLPL